MLSILLSEQLSAKEEVHHVCQLLFPDDVEVKVREVRRNVLPQKTRPVVSKASKKIVLDRPRSAFVSEPRRT